MKRKDPIIGKQLANYKIERVLGRGGMATVYYAVDVKLQRPAAVKVIDAQYMENPSFAQRFVDEARVMASWRHEHIAQVYYADEIDKLYFFAMEYIDGQSLGQIMAEQVASRDLMPHNEVLRIGRAVAIALDYAHSRGVIHRDVKPSNIMVAQDGRVVLTDFGLALDVQQGSIGEVFGTPHYIAPEQALSSAAAVPQSDLYALGVVLYEMLTGAVPFDDVSPTSLAMQHLKLPPPSPTQINPALNAEIEAVLLKALAKESSDRYQSGQELINALSEALASKKKKSSKRPELPPVPVSVDSKVSRPATTKTTIFGKVARSVETTPQQESRSKSRLPVRLLLLLILLLAGVGGFVLLNSDGDVLPAVGSSNTESPAVASGNTIPVRLYYNADSFYLRNEGDYALRPSQFRFEALNDSGEPAAYRLNGFEWGQIDRLLGGSKCLAVEVFSGTDYLKPEDCGGQFDAFLYPAATERRVFWVERDNVAEFRVLWEEQEITRCPVGDGQCTFAIPRPTEDD